MENIWITSDLHIGHNKDFIYEQRGFNSIEEHDYAILSNWNSLVSPDDTVYVLGDLIMQNGPEDIFFSYGLSVLEKLNGNITVVKGNHDTVNKIEKYKKLPNITHVNENGSMYYKYPYIGSYNFYLSHYPALLAEGKLKPMKTAIINLFGHTHQSELFYGNNPYMYCVCVDAHDMKPVLIDDIIDDIKQKKSTIINCE